jgi:hypothetical protein
MPLILGTNSIKDTGFDVANSVRLQDAYFNRSITPSSATSWTLSFWIKISGHNGSSEGYLWSCGSSSEAQGFYISASSYLGYYGATGYGSDSTLSQGVLRDSSAWYHICFSVNSGTGTLYINGVQDATMSSVAPLNAHTGNEMTVNTYSGDKAGFDNFLGYMAEYVFIDGTALTPTSFGEFDEDSGIWKPIDVSGLTFGTNGFYLDFENSGSLGADVSGNGNNFTVNNLTSIDQTTDTCTNNFATGNPLIPSTSLSDGNLTISASASVSRTAFSTISVSQGKWYFEMKPSASAGMIGITDISQAVYSNHVGSTSRGYGYNYNGEKYNNGSSSGFGNTFGSGDIIGCAVDLDNNKIYFSKNGTWQNSGDPTSGATGTGSAFDITDGYSYSLAFHAFNGSTTNGNFGNPPFTISSGNSDGNGYGNFEYAVPSGYYAINSKNLAEYG